MLPGDLSGRAEERNVGKTITSTSEWKLGQRKLVKYLYLLGGGTTGIAYGAINVKEPDKH